MIKLSYQFDKALIHFRRRQDNINPNTFNNKHPYL